VVECAAGLPAPAARGQKDDLKPHESDSHLIGIVQVTRLYNKNPVFRSILEPFFCGQGSLESVLEIGRNSPYS
jgi:hypothetical protein